GAFVHGTSGPVPLPLRGGEVEREHQRGVIEGDGDVADGGAAAGRALPRPAADRARRTGADRDDELAASGHHGPPAGAMIRDGAAEPAVERGADVVLRALAEEARAHVLDR